MESWATSSPRPSRSVTVAVNLIPVTGQPLPLISRGGTSTVITCIYFGIILSVSRFGAGMGEDEIVEETEEATEETEINDEADSDETEKLGKKTITELETIVE